MNHYVQEPPRTEQGGLLNKNTGFPEPLSTDRNTTLPFPTADTSKGAAIEAADIPVSRTRSRLGLSLHRKSQSQSKSGKLGSSNNAEGLKVGGEGGDGQNVVNENGIQLVEERDEQGYGPGERKKGILRKKQLHKV